MSGRRGKLLPSREGELSTLTDDDSDLDEIPPRNGNSKKLKLSRNEIIAIVVGCVILVCAVFLFVIIGVTTSSSSSQAGAAPQQPWMSGRLPASISPELYTIDLQVDLSSNDVSGSVQIDTTVTTPTPFVVLHAKDMSITSVVISQGGNMDIVEQKMYPSNEYYVVTLSTSASVGPLRISMKFNYTLAKDLAGFYRSSYLTSSGERKALACTQFEATSARRAFPCFDEPALKANFSVSITHDPALRAVSNMPMKSTETVQGSLRKTTFNTSVQMSTYLVAFVVSDFEHKSNITAGHPKISVWSKPGALDHAEYALDVATKVLKHYEEFFNIPYPLPKQDLFAIPDFAAGAMENWGLITYRETAMLYNPETDPAWAKQRVAVVVAHELAHQWFGNLVTMKWWNDLWLNEGFASYVEYLGADYADRSLHLQDKFIISDYQTALKLDSLTSSHPIEAEVSSADEIDSQFDDISYDKGASLLRMLNHYLGDDVFKKGLNVYLTKHKFGNAEMSDLWEALDSVASKDVPVKEFMSRWTEQMGFPVIDVQRTGRTATLQQKRFLSVQVENGSSTVASPFDYKWIISLNYITKASPKAAETLILRNEPVRVTVDSADDWIKFNVDHTAFVRVNYDQDGWQKLIKLFPTTINTDHSLTAADRSGLIDDAFALASAPYPKIDINIPLKLVQSLVNETSYVPWYTAVSWLRVIGTQLQYSPVFGEFKKQVLRIIQPQTRQLPWDTAGKTLSNNDIFLRSLLFGASWKFGDQEILDRAYKMFQDFMVNSTRVDPNLKDVVYGAGVAKGSVVEWNYLWGIYNTTTDPQEQSIVLRALAQSQEHWILSKYLQYALTKVRSQDTLYVFHYIAQNEHGLQLAWNSFVQHWPVLLKRYGIGSFAMRRILHTFGKSFTTAVQLKEFQEFFTDDTIRMSRGVQQAIEMLRGNVWWQSHVYPDMDNWLRDNSQ